MAIVKASKDRMRDLITGASTEPKTAESSSESKKDQ